MLKCKWVSTSPLDFAWETLTRGSPSDCPVFLCYDVHYML
nr:MAG TPA: hypothetical protein [Caudoviricetes sp.]